MRRMADPSERFAPTRAAGSGDFAPLFNQLAAPIDASAICDGMKSLSRWLGSPQLRWRTGVDR
ncbi:MAG: hypothetical protein Q7J32_09895 [Sphingomonadaceae bacterium]|nr:hypothetical protein [Sphingomonadaceae bacterium]